MDIKAWILLCCISISQAASVTTSQYSNSRDGSTSESILTRSNVNSSQFGKLTTFGVDGAVYAQPLIIEGAPSSVIVVTMHGSIYSFNEDTYTRIWKTTLSAPLTSYGWLPSYHDYYDAEIGCVATPAIDATNGWIFAACIDATPNWTLYKINLTTGAVISSVVISGTVVGTGDTTNVPDRTSGANLLFYPQYENLRTPLTLANNNVYFCTSSFGDNHPWHGWCFAYSESALAQVGLSCLTPNGYGAGVWSPSGGVSADGSGNVYVATGNGTYDGILEYGQSIIKFSSALAILDWFTPANNAATSAVDKDVGSGNALILIPNTPYLAFASKDSRAWVLNTSDMGHLQGSGTLPQVFTLAGLGDPVFGGIYANGTAYWPTAGDNIYAYAFSGSTFNTTPVAQTAVGFNFITALSASGPAAGLIWGVTPASAADSSPVTGTLRAWNSSTMVEIWNSASTLGQLAKFSSPVVHNGKVYVSTYNSGIGVYGLLPSSMQRGITAIRGSAAHR